MRYPKYNWLSRSVLLTVLGLSPLLNSVRAQDENGVFWDIAELALNVVGKVVDTEVAIENLELLAADIVLTERPLTQTVKVKAMNLESYDAAQIWSQQSFAFGITFYDIENNDLVNREVLLVLPAPGWITPYGAFDLSLLNWEFYDKLLWGDMMAEYVDMCSPLKVENGRIAVTKELDQSLYEVDNPNHLAVTKLGTMQSVEYFSLTSEYSLTHELRMTRNGFACNSTSNDAEIPVFDIRGDDYLFRPYGEDRILVANEKKFGIYSKQRRQTMYYPRPHIWNIQSFLFGKDEIKYDASSEAIQVSGLISAQDKSKWGIGDTGKYNVSGADWVTFEVVAFQNEDDPTKRAARIKYSIDDGENQKWLRVNSDKLMWKDEKPD